MKETFRALLLTKDGAGHQHHQIVNLNDDDLMPGDVTVRIHHSSVNYKDGLAITGKAPIPTRYPLIPGIDFAGEVVSSHHPRWHKGDLVILNGWGVGEQHHGGFSQRARVNGDWLVALPEGWSTAEAMAIGVAGFTAMLCVMALEEQGLKPGDGEVLVTGAAGGVGSTTVLMLHHLGHHVVASTGRMGEQGFLKNLGAAEVINREVFNTPVRALAKQRWAACVDSVGSVTLANVLSQMREEGVVAACGLAQGMDLPATVAPFILRGVKLIGINSVTTPKPKRESAWARIAAEVDRDRLAELTTHVRLDDVPDVAAKIVQGQVRGRVVVDITPA